MDSNWIGRTIILHLRRRRSDREQESAKRLYPGAVQHSSCCVECGLPRTAWKSLFSCTGAISGFQKIPMDKTLAQAERQEIPRGALLGSTSDGNGIGYIVVASLGMRLFGLHSSSLLLSMLALMGISALAFLWHFRDKRLCSQHDDRRYPIFFVGCDIASIPPLTGVRRCPRTGFPND